MRENRTNRKLNEMIEQKIRQWNGTVFGTVLNTMYHKGASYESICEYAGIDYSEFEED